MLRIAVIDIGTQSVLFLVMEISPSSWRPLAVDTIPIRLGKGLTHHGLIESDRAQALIECMKELKARVRSLNTNRIVAVGTQVFRAAQNRNRVINSVRDETDIWIEVLSVKEEAEWSFKGMLWGRGIDSPVLTTDIGGGSTELIAGSPSGIEAFNSLPFGVVVLTESFIKSDPPSDDEFRDMQRHILDILGSVPSNLKTGSGRLLASGGTATTLAAMELAMTDYDPDRADGFILTRNRLEERIAQFRFLPLESRRQLTGLEPRRADIILAGSIILLGVMDWADFDQVTICDRGLRHGIVLRELEDMQSA